MKIFVFSDGVRHGCYIHREEIPLEALERRGHQVDGGCPPGSELFQAKFGPGGDVKDCDLFIMPRLFAADYPLVVDELKRNGKPIVYEMDDAADLFERFHTSYFQVRNLLPSYYYFLHEADLVTTTTPHLAEHFRSLGAKRVEVLPNCPAPVQWTNPPTQGPVRIGFTGWTAHIQDATFWMEVMAALWSLRKDFVPVLFGISTTSCTGPQWMEKCKEAVLANPIPNHEFGQSLIDFRVSWVRLRETMGKNLEWHSMVPVDDYWTTLANLKLDIGCAVLLDSPFNQCKSCVKFYDFAGAGAVTLASEVLPYTEEPVVVVPNRLDAWVRMLSLYIDSRLVRHQKLAQQRAWIKVNRDVDVWAGVRERAYLSLLNPQASRVEVA